MNIELDDPFFLLIFVYSAWCLLLSFGSRDYEEEEYKLKDSKDKIIKKINDKINNKIK
tara:strand:- start:376 stop:549 length:174 start_codon:yes stop_codon:yes gene_type:complete